MDAKRHDVTDLLVRWNSGDLHARDEIMPLVTKELRRLAQHYLQGERGAHTLQATALVNELYLRLVDRKRVSWRDRAHFFAFAATSMRRILVDHGRAHRAAKRGGGAASITLDDALGVPDQAAIDVVALDDALRDLAKLDPQLTRIVELRFFAGLSIRESAEVLGMGEATIVRRWATARAWLYRELGPAD